MFRKAILLSLCMMLAACGGHGFEGKYESKVESGMLGNMANMMPQSTLIIGSDFIENDGKRVEMDEIFVRESNGKAYLVLSKGGSEEVFEIADDKVLVQDMGMMKIKFVRVD